MNHNETNEVCVLTFLNTIKPIPESFGVSNYHYGWQIKNAFNHALNESLFLDARDFYEFEVSTQKLEAFIEWLTSHVDTKAFHLLNIKWSSDFALSSSYVSQLSKAFNDHLRVAAQSIYHREQEAHFELYLHFSSALNFCSNNGAVLLSKSQQS